MIKPLYALLVATLLAEPKGVEIRLEPRSFFADGDVRLTCTVPRHPLNRRLGYGIAEYRHSERDLDGEHAPITYETWIKHVPCGVGPAYCAVARSDLTIERVVLPLNIANCEGV